MEVHENALKARQIGVQERVRSKDANLYDLDSLSNSGANRDPSSMGKQIIG